MRVPRYCATAPKILTHIEYANLLGVPEWRTAHRKRDVALLRVLGDCGLRSAELWALVGP